MKIISITLSLLLIAPVTALAQPDDSLRAAALRSATNLALTAPSASDQEGGDDWAKVRRLEPGSQVRVTLRDGAVREGRLDSVLDDRIVISPGSTLQRESIDRVERRTRGSIVGGIVGAAAGAFLGVFTAAHLAFRQCEESCADEKLLMGASLIGMPVAGGYLGAKFAPRRAWTTVYRGR